MAVAACPIINIASAKAMAKVEKATKSSNGRVLGIAIVGRKGESDLPTASERMKKEMTKPSLDGNYEASPEVEKPLVRACGAFRLRVLDGLSDFDRKYMPFSRLEDCRLGSARRRDKAFLANKENKAVILPYLAAWLMRGLTMAAGMVTAANLERLGMDTACFQAGFAICLSGCIVISSVLWVGWLGLTFFKE